MINVNGDRSVLLPERIQESVIRNNIIVGVSAVLLNGYSYDNPSLAFDVYTPVPFLHGLKTPIRNLIYLPNYNTQLGIENNVPNAERTICDFLMYPEELHAMGGLLDAMEGYQEEFGSFNRVYEMMDQLGIGHEKLNVWIPHMWEGSNM